MPWHVAQTAKCPAGKPWGVIKDSDGSVAGCHPTKAAAGRQLAALYANEPGAKMSEPSDPVRASMDNSAWDGNAAMSACKTAADYAAICAGRKAGPPGERGSYALPHHKHPGDAPNVTGTRNALSRLPQGLTNAAAARKHLETHMAAVQSNAAHHAPDLDVVRSGGGMELRSADDGSLGTLAGRFSEFGRWYRVSSIFEGDFMERVKAGSTADTIRDNRDAMRVLFDHGTDRQIGNKVLGPINVLEEKSDGPHYEVPLFDTSYNRDLLPGLKAKVYGASMRMRVTADEWDDEPPKSDTNPYGIPERTITRMKVLEFGPVTFPANPGASAGIRSGTDEFYHRLRQVNAPAFEDALRACGLSAELIEAGVRSGLSLEDFTGRDGARSAPGGDRTDVQPGNGGTSPANTRAAQRDRAWRMRRQPYA